jgi:hypothetical protein
MSKLDDKTLSKTLAQVCEPQIDEYTKCDEIPDNYEFSAEFEEKMDKIIRKQKRHRFTFKACKKRLVSTAAAALIIFFAGVFIGAANEPIHSLVLNFFSDSKTLSVSSEAEENSDKTIQTVYTLSDVPNGYELLDVRTDPTFYSETYVGENSLIYFGQFVAATYKDIPVGNSDKMEYYTDENGQEYLIITYENTAGSSVIWYNGDYVFLLSSHLNKDEAINLCKTVKIKNQ